MSSVYFMSGLYVVVLLPPSRYVCPASGVSSMWANCAFVRVVPFLFFLSLGCVSPCGAPSVKPLVRLARPGCLCSFLYFSLSFSLSLTSSSRVSSGVGVNLWLRRCAGERRFVRLSFVASSLLPYRLGIFARDGARRPFSGPPSVRCWSRGCP